MAFVVEDGTGLTNSNSYASVAEADAYIADRGLVGWPADNTAKQQALVKATDYVERRWGRGFAGERSTATQALSWPRDNAYNADVVALTLVPAKLKQAVIEFALRSAQGINLMPDPTPDFATAGSPGQVIKKAEKIGDLWQDITYKQYGRGNSRSYFYILPSADILMEAVLAQQGELIR